MQPPGVLWDSKRVLEYCRVGKLASDETGFLDMTYPMVSKVVCQRIRDRKVNMCIYEENKSTTLGECDEHMRIFRFRVLMISRVSLSADPRGMYEALCSALLSSDAPTLDIST